MDLIHIHRTLHPKPVEYTFFTNAYGSFSRIDNMLGHKTSCNKFKMTVIIPSIFNNYNNKKLKTSNRKKVGGGITNMWRLSNTLLKKQWSNKGNKTKKGP